MIAHLYRIIIEVCWGLGVLSLLIAVALKFSAQLAEMLNATPRGGIVLAGALFLAVLATQGMKREQLSGS